MAVATKHRRGDASAAASRPASAGPTRPRVKRAKDDALFRRDIRPLMWLMIPTALAVIVIDLLPVLIGVYNSFRRLAFSTLEHWMSAPWLGLTNYRQAIHGQGGMTVSAPTAVWHSLEYSVLTTALALVVGVTAALTVVSRTSRATPIIRSIYLIPTAIPLFSSAYLWYTILLPSTGLFDVLRRDLGMGHAANRLLAGDHSLLVLIFVDLWLAWGFIYLFALAGLQGIRQELYEAAYIDGASPWLRFRYVTYPGLRKVLASAAVLSTFGHYNNFTLPYVLFGQSPPPGVAVLPTATYQTAYSIYNFGLADAVAVIGLIVIIIPVLVYVKYVFSARRAA